MYNLLDRNEYEETFADVISAHHLASIPYFGLARGFLSGKYREGSEGVEVESVRSHGVAQYKNARGWRTVQALREIAENHGSSVSAVALAWLRAQPTVSVPIASARTVQQVKEITQIVQLSLEEITRLSEITA